MVSNHEGDLLKSNCEIICHQVNLQGIMGGGIAYQIALKYPKVKNEYCDFVKGQKNLGGKVCGVRIGDQKFILNCFTQDENFNTRYDWVKKCFEQICNEVSNSVIFSNLKVIRVGVPFKYGCGIAKGDWDKVLAIFKEIFEDQQNIDFQIWKLKI